MGRYGPYLQCGERSTAAIAHASTANKKNPNDLSLPSQLPSIDQLRRPSESGSTTDVSASDGKANGNNGQRNETALAADEDAAKASAVLTAEDVMAFGFGLDGSASNDTLAAEISPSSSLVEGGGGQGSASGAWYSAVSLERAVGLLSLPRVVCESHPEHGGEVEVGVSRFGVFVKHNELYSMVPNGVDVLDVDKAMALDLVDATIQVRHGMKLGGVRYIASMCRQPFQSHFLSNTCCSLKGFSLASACGLALRVPLLTRPPAWCVARLPEEYRQANDRARGAQRTQGAGQVWPLGKVYLLQRGPGAGMLLFTSRRPYRSNAFVHCPSIVHLSSVYLLEVVTALWGPECMCPRDIQRKYASLHAVPRRVLSSFYMRMSGLFISCAEHGIPPYPDDCFGSRGSQLRAVTSIKEVNSPTCDVRCRSAYVIFLTIIGALSEKFSTRQEAYNLCTISSRIFAKRSTQEEAPPPTRFLRQKSPPPIPRLLSSPINFASYVEDVSHYLGISCIRNEAHSAGSWCS